jgi:hypothetical protein
LEANFDDEVTLSQGDIVNLNPYKGNIHSFKAEEDTIIFDILTPNYDDIYRFCNMYREVEINSSEVSTATSLSEILEDKCDRKSKIIL